MTRADAAVQAIYRARLDRDPQAISRVIGLFAQRSLLPSRFECRAADEFLAVEIEIPLESGRAAELILQKLRSLVLVDHAELTERTD